MLENLLDATSAEALRTSRCARDWPEALPRARSRPTPRLQPDTPFSEEQPRLPYENFYYVQEDILFAAAEREGFTWSVHRPHTLIGWALGNAMNMGVTLAVYAAICRETGRGFHFPGLTRAVGGRHRRDRRRSSRRSSRLGCDDPGGRNHALNIVNGDVFRWRRMWPTSRRGARRRAGAVRRRAGTARAADGRRRRDLAWNRPALRPSRSRRRATRVLVAHGRRPGRTIETFTDMGRNRRLGFNGVRDTSRPSSTFSRGSRPSGSSRES